MAAWAIWLLGGFTAGAGALLTLWAVFWDRSRGRPRCPRCWYDLSGGAPDSGPTAAAPVICPECGKRIIRARQMRRTRRRYGIGLAAAAVALSAGWIAPVWATRGWIAATPQPALDVVIRAFYAEDAAKLISSGSSFRGGANSWERALASWELRRRWTDLSRERDLPAAGGGLTEDATRQFIHEQYQRTSRRRSEVGRIHIATIMVLMSAEPAERRGLGAALGRAALNSHHTIDSSLVQRYALSSIEFSRSRSGEAEPSALPPLWHLARRIEGKTACGRLLEALIAADPRCPIIENKDLRGAWFDSILRQKRMAPDMWQVVMFAAIADGPTGITAAEAEIWRAPEHDLAAAVERMHATALVGRQRDAIYPALLRLVEHPDPAVRAVSVEALSWAAARFPQALPAVERALHDPAPDVTAAAQAALDRLGG